MQDCWTDSRLSPTWPSPVNVFFDRQLGRADAEALVAHIEADDGYRLGPGAPGNQYVPAHGDDDHTTDPLAVPTAPASKSIGSPGPASRRRYRQ